MATSREVKIEGWDGSDDSFPCILYFRALYYVFVLSIPKKKKRIQTLKVGRELFDSIPVITEQYFRVSKCGIPP